MVRLAFVNNQIDFFKLTKAFYQEFDCSKIPGFTFEFVGFNNSGLTAHYNSTSNIVGDKTKQVVTTETGIYEKSWSIVMTVTEKFDWSYS